jgi:hypothetical protein
MDIDLFLLNFINQRYSRIIVDLIDEEDYEKLLRGIHIKLTRNLCNPKSFKEKFSMISLIISNSAI